MRVRIRLTYRGENSLRLQLDLFARLTWVLAGMLFGLVIPLIVFLSGDEFLLTIIATAMGAGFGFALWSASQRGSGRG